MTARNPVPKDIPKLRTLWKQAFGDSDSFLDIFFEAAFSLNRCLFIPDEYGNPVSALYLLDCTYGDVKAAYIYAVATDEGMRGRGLGALLMKDTEEYLRGLGYDAVFLVPASDRLRAYYGKIGYSTATFVDVIDVSAAKEATELTIIDKDEYSALRRQYLPENSVLQEDASMEFLSRQAILCKGDDFLLTYRIEKDGLFGIELLGNTARASEILKAAGVDRGVFRTVGKTVPFAMHLALTEKGKALPSHFGFAFD